MQEGSANKNTWAAMLGNASPAALDKDTAWEKLQQRLTAGTNKKSLFIFRWAAILLFVTGVAGYFITNTTDTGDRPLSKTVLAPRTANNNPKENTPAATPVTIQKNHNTPATLQHREKEKSIATADKKRTEEIVRDNIADEYATAMQQQPVTIEIPITNAITKQENTAKKGLKVVHINELENNLQIMPPQPANKSMASKPGIPMLRKPLRNAEETEDQPLTTPVRKRFLSIGSVAANKE
jgi:hypothetical protein